MEKTYYTYSSQNLPASLIKLFETKKACQEDYDKHYPKQYKSLRDVAQMGGIKVKKITIRW